VERTPNLPNVSHLHSRLDKSCTPCRSLGTGEGIKTLDYIAVVGRWFVLKFPGFNSLVRAGAKRRTKTVGASLVERSRTGRERASD
jgi:hypothetical protein